MKTELRGKIKQKFWVRSTCTDGKFGAGKSILTTLWKIERRLDAIARKELAGAK
jgi:hypothetical protein